MKNYILKSGRLLILTIICILMSNITAYLSAQKTNNDSILRLLIWEGHAPGQFVENFEKIISEKYNRKDKLEFTYVKGSNDFYNAVRSKSVDVIMMTHHHFKDDKYNYIKNNLVLPLDLNNIPNFKNVIPDLQNAEYLISNKKIYAVPLSQGPYGLVYNRSLLNEEPDSWNILWDPEMKGKYTISKNEYIYNINITALALGYSKDSISDFDTLNNQEFKDKLRQLVLNAHSFWVGVDKPENLSGLTLATS